MDQAKSERSYAYFTAIDQFKLDQMAQQHVNANQRPAIHYRRLYESVLSGPIDPDSVHGAGSIGIVCKRKRMLAQILEVQSGDQLRGNDEVAIESGVEHKLNSVYSDVRQAK